MAAKSLKELKNEWKALVESEELKGAGGGSGTDTGHDEDGGAAKAYGGASVKGNEDEGVEKAPKSFEPKNGDLGNTKSVDREAGASAGRKETGDGDKEGSDKEVEGANPVDRAEGAEGAPKEWGGSVGEFRNRVRSVLGLPLDDAKNKGNDGLNKDGKTGDVKKNLG